MEHPEKTQKKTLRLLDVFAGMGGLSLGFERAGHRSVLALEKERAPAAVYAANRPGVPVLLGDCTKFSPGELRKAIGSVDAICGGVPCEPFSKARGFDMSGKDPRRNLIGYALKLVLAFRPRVFCYENVWAAADSPGWKRALKAAQKAGYAAAFWKLNASDYGSPQMRKRVFFVGVRGAARELQEPPASAGKVKTVREALRGLGEPREGHADPLHSPRLLSDRTRRAAAMTPLGGMLKKHCPGYSGMMDYVADPDAPVHTVLSTSGGQIHWGRKRYLSVREAARLQEVPRSYKFPVSVNAAGTCIGDAVPLSLSSAVAKHLCAFVSKSVSDGASEEVLAAALAEIGKQLRVGSERDYIEKQLVSEIGAQADRASKDDKLTLGEFFPQPKPTRPAYPQQPQTVGSLISLYKERPEWLPAFIQKKYDGVRVQIHKNDKKVLIVTEDGTDVTDRLPATVEEIKKLKEKKLVLDAEVERWDGPHHLPREAASGYLNAETDPDDSDVMVNVFDVLLTATDGDIHTKPTHERLRKLAGLGIRQSTMEAPSLKGRLNAAPGIKVNDLEELEKVVRMVRELPGSEGVVVKQVDSEYPLEKEAVDTWVKYHNASLVRGLVQGRTKVKDGGWVYQWAVLPGKEDPAEIATVDGKEVVSVGDTFTTKLDYDEGDPILVEVEQLNLTKTPEGVEITGWVPRVIGDYAGKADTVDKAVARAKKDLVLRVKEVDEEGEVSYVPVVRVLKQADPYMEIPDESGRYRYSVSHHFRGKSLHADLRIGFRPGKLLVGWTLNTQIAGVVKDPVVTLAQAKAWARRMDDVSKINWGTGEWAEREKRGAKEPVRVSILSERKSPEPWPWIDVEGKTKDPEPGKPPPVGGTKQYPGVFHIVDEGTAEYGAQKPWFHEYFFHGGGLNYRMFFRQLRLGKLEKARHSYSRCIECGKSAPVVDVLWADGRGRAWFCKACYGVWLRRMGGRKKAEVVGEKKILGGNAPAKFSDVHKSVEVSKSAEPHPVAVEKRKILPPSEAPPAPGYDEPSWLAIYPDDPTPYVLGKDAVDKGWMPPLGKSALPKAVRSQVPAEYRYWGKRTLADARKARAALVAAVKAGDVDLDYASRTRKASRLDADFVLQEQTWRGPVQIRTGPSRTIWRLLLDVGRPSAVELRMMLNPIDNEELTLFMDSARKGALAVEGPIKPGHYLNPTKATPSNVSILDKGKAEVLSMFKDFVKVRLAGKRLKGLYAATRNNSEWLWAPAQASPETEDVEKRAARVVASSWFVPILKVDKEKRLVTGIVLEPGEVDAQKDIISAEVIEKACHKFLASYNDRTRLGLMHKAFGDVGLELAECWIAHEPTKMNGRKVKKGSWLMTEKVTSDALWKKVKRGVYGGFSIGGVATVGG